VPLSSSSRFGAPLAARRVFVAARPFGARAVLVRRSSRSFSGLVAVPRVPAGACLRSAPASPSRAVCPSWSGAARRCLPAVGAGRPSLPPARSPGRPPRRCARSRAPLAVLSAGCAARSPLPWRSAKPSSFAARPVLRPGSLFSEVRRVCFAPLALRVAGSSPWFLGLGVPPRRARLARRAPARLAFPAGRARAWLSVLRRAAPSRRPAGRCAFRRPSSSPPARSAPPGAARAPSARPPPGSCAPGAGARPSCRVGLGTRCRPGRPDPRPRPRRAWHPARFVLTPALLAPAFTRGLHHGSHPCLCPAVPPLSLARRLPRSRPSRVRRPAIPPGQQPAPPARLPPSAAPSRSDLYRRPGRPLAGRGGRPAQLLATLSQSKTSNKFYYQNVSLMSGFALVHVI